MKPFICLSGLILASVAAGCGGDTPTTPSPASSSMFNAMLFSSGVPVGGSEAGGRRASVQPVQTRPNITAATMDATVSVTGFLPEPR